MKQIENYENFRFLITEYKRPRLIHWHAYPWHQINYIQHGNGILKTNELTLELKEGDLYYIPQGQNYTCHWTAPYTRLRAMGFRIFPDAQETPFAIQKLPSEYVARFRQVPVQIRPDAQALGLFYTILGQLVPSMTRQGMTATQKLVDEAKKLMSALYLHWPISSIAQYLNVSESTLYLAFQKLERKTPNQVRHEYAMKEAVRMLTSTSNSISKISEYIGCSSDTYFRKIFKDYTGKSPRQVRKEGL